MTDFFLPFTGNFPITLKYGSTLPAKFGGGITHSVDYGVPAGTPILASAEGIVKATDWNKGGGNVIDIEHDNSITTSYGHLASFAVRPGEKVRQGDIIGYSGNTGEYTTGPHLLFGAKQNGNAINPSTLFGVEPKSSSVETKTQDNGLFGIPGAIGDAAFSFGFIFLGAILLLAGVLIMRK